MAPVRLDGYISEPFASRRRPADHQLFFPFAAVAYLPASDVFCVVHFIHNVAFSGNYRVRVTIGDIIVRRVGRDLVFERDRYSIAVRSTVGDRATIEFSFAGEMISQVTGVRLNPAVISGVILGALHARPDP